MKLFFFFFFFLHREIIKSLPFAKLVLTSQYINLDNVLFYSVFHAFHRKNNSSIVLQNLNPEGPSDSYVCEVTPPA